MKHRMSHYKEIRDATPCGQETSLKKDYSKHIHILF